MASLDRQFRALLRSHLERTGTSGRRFGVEALKDPGFVASLARGRRLGLKTVDTLLAFMGYPPLGAAFRREVEAFLRVTGTKAYVLGEVVLNDATFVDRLRRGASLRLATVEKVRAWMAGQACAAALVAMRAAVAGAPLISDGDGPSGDCEETGDHDMKNEDSDYLSTRKAAASLGLSPRTLDRYRLSGEGPAYYRFGNRIVYHRADLESWAAARRVPGPGENGGAPTTPATPRGTDTRPGAPR